MIIRSLNLTNFRNYHELGLQLPGGLVALCGDNGQGKTNLLEALCVLATTRSPLVDRERELMHWNTTRTEIAAEVELAREPGYGRHLRFSWKLRGNSLERELSAGGVPQSVLSRWLGLLQVVAFFPHDLVLVAGEPGERRRFLNMELGKADPAHFEDITRYRRVVAQRNALLRRMQENRYSRELATGPGPGVATGGEENEGQPATLPEWNQLVAEYGSRIIARRVLFFREMTPLLQEAHTCLSGVDDIFTMAYLPGVSGVKGVDGIDPPFAADAGFWRTRLQEALEDDAYQDLRRATTGSGPHRDDMTFLRGEMNLRRFGSQGQGRLAVLALKVALAQWVEKTTGEAPVVLLDDALSELDASRKALLLREVRRFPQCVVTATDPTFARESGATVLRVHNGAVTPV